METDFSPEPRAGETLEDRVRRIPLPNQVPRGLDFSGIPAAALRSSTLESLISQNEDLMARLSVSLRKINALEEAGARTDRDLVQLRQRYDGLKEQYLVLREKDRISVSRAAELQRETLAARERTERLEKEFAHVFVQAQAFQRRLVSLERYRARVRRAARAVSAKARRADILTQQLRTVEAALETRVGDFEQRLNLARQHAESLADKAEQSDERLAAQIRLENQLVAERRAHADVLETARAELQLALNANQTLREKYQTSSADLERAAAELTERNAELPRLKAERETLIEQVESLQSLWNAQRRELDRADEKNTNLQKLNQSLSVTLNERRRELTELRAVHEQERFANETRFDTLRAEIKMLRRMAQTKD